MIPIKDFNIFQPGFEPTTKVDVSAEMVILMETVFYVNKMGNFILKKTNFYHFVILNWFLGTVFCPIDIYLLSGPSGSQTFSSVTLLDLGCWARARALSCALPSMPSIRGNWSPRFNQLFRYLGENIKDKRSEHVNVTHSSLTVSELRFYQFQF